MGEVFCARDTRLGREVVVKVLPDHLANDPKALHRFETEAKALAAANEAVERHLKLPPAEARKNVRDLACALFHVERWAEALPVLREAARALPETYPTFVGLEALAAFRLGDTATARRIEEELRTTTR